MLTTKKCTKCKITKDLSEFYKNKKGHISACKKCTKRQVKLYRDNNVDKVKECSKKHYRENKIKICDRVKKYRDNNPEVMKVYRESNKDKISKQAKEYNTKNKDRLKKIRDDKKGLLREYYKKYYDKNKEEIKCRTHTYRNSDKYKLMCVNYGARYRAHKLNASDGTLPQLVTYPLIEELQELLTRQDNKCNNCKCDITKEKHLDHHIPLSKGGAHSIGNVVWLCPKCNLSKSNKVPTELLLI